MHQQLLDLETKLTILMNNPCACTVCRDAARLAKVVLRDVSPAAAVLLEIPQDTPEFRAAEQKFHSDEIGRLQFAYDEIGRGRCELVPPPRLDTSPAPAPPIPELPDADAFRDRVEFYRKHAMKPRMIHRRRSITMKKNPRIPGSYVIR